MKNPTRNSLKKTFSMVLLSTIKFKNVLLFFYYPNTLKTFSIKTKKQLKNDCRFITQCC